MRVIFLMFVCLMYSIMNRMLRNKVVREVLFLDARFGGIRIIFFLLSPGNLLIIFF